MKPNSIPEKIRFAALAVDVVCFRVKDGKLEILLGKVQSETNVFKGKWAHIGGLIEIKETAEDSVKRLLKVKAGINDIYNEQLYTFSSIDRDPRGRVVSVAYIALANNDLEQDFENAGTETVWKTLPINTKLAYDHDEITKIAINRLRSKIIYTDIARYFMPKEFTLSELQKVYEAVTGELVDKRNFRKRILSLNILKDTKKTLKKGVMRPAALYSFK